MTGIADLQSTSSLTCATCVAPTSSDHCSPAIAGAPANWIASDGAARGFYPDATWSLLERSSSCMLSSAVFDAARLACVRSTHHIWSRSCVPARCSTRADCSNAPPRSARTPGRSSPQAPDWRSPETHSSIGFDAMKGRGLPAPRDPGECWGVSHPHTFGGGPYE